MMGSSFKDLWNDPEFMDDAQREKINLEVSLIGRLIEAREKKGITQQKLADMSGMKQSAIARIEKLSATPKIDTMIRLLKPLGYKLDIVPIE
jgi:ribosome-binding protein aMBF1 (putative translation factor)